LLYNPLLGGPHGKFSVTIIRNLDPEVRHIEGAAFVAQLAEVNDPSELRTKCEANVKQVADSYLRCTLPDVWVRGPQPQTKKAAR
jgi:hypothetical protein